MYLGGFESASESLPGATHTEVRPRLLRQNFGAPAKFPTAAHIALLQYFATCPTAFCCHALLPIMLQGNSVLCHLEAAATV